MKVLTASLEEEVLNKGLARVLRSKLSLFQIQYGLHEVAISQDGRGRSIAWDYSDPHEVVLAMPSGS